MIKVGGPRHLYVLVVFLRQSSCHEHTEEKKIYQRRTIHVHDVANRSQNGEAIRVFTIRVCDSKLWEGDVSVMYVPPSVILSGK